MITITKRLEFDAGHRIPDHKSKCRNLHGHRYVLEIRLDGNPIDAPGTSDHGMLMDFADVKKIANELIVDRWDHAFLVYKGDTAVNTFLNTLPNHKTVSLDRVPTAENLAQIVFDTLDRAYSDKFNNNLKLRSIRLYETPNCWAEVSQ